MSKAVSCCVLFASLFLTIISGTTGVGVGVEEGNGNCVYCVANPKASTKLIQAKLDFCCGYIPESCDLIQPGEPCYVPNNRRATASYVFNDWFLGGAECNFDGAEIVTNRDSSHGDCKFKCRKW